MKSSSHIPIILASSSPRRIDLMNQARLNIETYIPDLNETPHKNEKPKSLVMRLAQEKAESVQIVAIQKHKKCIIIAADTIVVSPIGKKILGKPKDELEAKKMLKILSGKKHSVFTGYCILLGHENKKSKMICRVVESKVKFRKLSENLIHQYIRTQEPMDKAGSYGAQGLGMAFIERIEGSYTNVIGLPMAEVLVDLEKLSKMPVYSWIQ